MNLNRERRTWVQELHPKERGEKKLRKDPEKERERKLGVGGR